VTQYDGNLKTERYGGKQVVLLSSLIRLYQGFNSEGNQKYEGRDVLESSLVSSRSKGGLAGRRTATFLICKPNFYFQSVKTKKIKEKVFVSHWRQVAT
jgi:hypothetical protein